MAILVDENTKILVQGITGSFGGRHAQLSLDYGTKLVAGVTPEKAGRVSLIPFPSLTRSKTRLVKPAPRSARFSFPLPLLEMRFSRQLMQV